MRTLAVALIICANSIAHVQFYPEVISGTPVPIQVVATEDCPDITHCDN